MASDRFSTQTNMGGQEGEQGYNTAAPLSVKGQKLQLAWKLVKVREQASVSHQKSPFSTLYHLYVTDGVRCKLNNFKTEGEGMSLKTECTKLALFQKTK